MAVTEAAKAAEIEVSRVFRKTASARPLVRVRGAQVQVVRRQRARTPPLLDQSRPG